MPTEFDRNGCFAGKRINAYDLNFFYPDTVSIIICQEKHLKKQKKHSRPSRREQYEFFQKLFHYAVIQINADNSV